MNEAEKIKELLTPIQVAKHYLGQPNKSSSLGLWYKSPFRNERTASFLVNDEKGLHDFGTSIHYDIISFVEDYFKVSFNTAIQILSRDFGIELEDNMDSELKEYIKRKQDENKQALYILNSWYNKTFGEICDELHIIQNAIPYLKGEALKIAYMQEVKLEYLSEVFMNAKDENKIKLFKEWRTKEDGNNKSRQGNDIR